VTGEQRNAEIVAHLRWLADNLSQEADRYRRLGQRALALEQRRNFLDHSLQLRIRAESIRRGLRDSRDNQI
jgi:hypothetical protein